MSTNPGTPQTEEPNVAGVKVRPGLALSLYGLLAISAGVALWAQRSPNSVPPLVASAAPFVFLLFAVGFAAYRFALVAANRYSAFKAFFQVAVMAVFFMLLVRAAPSTYWALPVAAPASPDMIAPLFSDSNARVRALAAELAQYRPASPAMTAALVAALDDADPAVKNAAHQSLVALNHGNDLGPSAIDWKEPTR